VQKRCENLKLITERKQQKRLQEYSVDEKGRLIQAVAQ